jgi:pyridoxal phosphate enzyme (YggS family)
MVERDAARIADNLAAVRQRIESAAKGSGRAADAVRLVAVTKYVGPAAAAALVEAGCHDLGESRPQELWRKAEALSGRPIRWHLIGHLQTNKVRRTLPLVSLIHSADSLRIIDALDEEGAVQQRRVPVLLEVNVSGDAAKHGFEPDAIEPLLGQFAERRHLEVRGLMAMSGLESDEAAAAGPAAAALSQWSGPRRAVDGDERRLRSGGRRGGDDRPCRFGAVRGSLW